MIFVRLVVSHTRDCINAVMTQDTPFERGMVEAEGEVCEIFDLGVVEDHAWTDRDGNPCAVHRHVFERLQHSGICARDLLERRVSPELHVEGTHGLAEVLEVREIIDAPCTIETLHARLRARGPEGVPMKVRAWLTLVMPWEAVQAMGIARGISLSSLRAADSLRRRRDPLGGSFKHVLDAIATAKQDALRRRIERQASEKVAREKAAAAAAALALGELQAERIAELESMHDTEGNVVNG